jgi:riboflavin kinase/FMN adenylyltransferase
VLRWRGLEATPGDLGRTVVTVGMYDGVHRGHQVLIGAAVSRARAMRRPCLLLTFDPHPAEVVRPGSHPAILTSLDRKAELVAELGVDAMCVLPFTPEFMRLSPETFTHTVLVEQLHAAQVVVGENFTYGHKAAGNVQTLTVEGRRFGFAVEGIPLAAVDDDAVTISSTYIRACVAAGDMASAGRALGRPHRVDGVVVRGDRRGRDMGYPTANVESPAFTAIPADGVYAGHLVTRDPRSGASRRQQSHVPGQPALRRGVRARLRRRPLRGARGRRVRRAAAADDRLPRRRGPARGHGEGRLRHPPDPRHVALYLRRVTDVCVQAAPVIQTGGHT